MHDLSQAQAGAPPDPILPSTDLVDAEHITEGDSVYALALQVPRPVVARSRDGAMIRLTFASTTVRLGRTTPVRRVRVSPAERARLDTLREISDALGCALLGGSEPWGAVICQGAGRPEVKYEIVGRHEGPPLTLTVRGPDGQVYDVRVPVEVTPRDCDGVNDGR